MQQFDLPTNSFLHLILICRANFVLLPTNRTELDTDDNIVTLVIIWALAVVAFFALWAILLKVVKCISEKKRPKEAAQDDIEKGDTPVTPTGV